MISTLADTLPNVSLKQVRRGKSSVVPIIAFKAGNLAEHKSFLEVALLGGHRL